MPENKFEKRRKQKKRTAIVASVSGVGVLILGIVAFLGRSVGSFTVKMDNEGVRLALSRKYASEEKTSFLLINKLPSFKQTEYSSLPKAEVLDDETYDYDSTEIGAAVRNPNTATDDEPDGQIQELKFFKYTFYVSNVGDKKADFNINFNIVENNKSTDGTNRSLLDVLHVEIFENAVTDDDKTKTHDSTFYANAPTYGTRSEIVDGKKVSRSDREYVSKGPDSKYWTGTMDAPTLFAEPFVKTGDEPSQIAVRNWKNLKSGEYVRYTFVCWLDGNDLDDQGGEPPQGASIKLEIKVNGYESKQQS
jgi:hypothetical protein